jgi:hypothetical protein
MTRSVSQLLFLAAAVISGFLLYLLLFWMGVGSSITILFYRGVVLAVLAGVATGVAAGWLRRRHGEASLAIAATAVSFSFNTCFLVLLPVTIDRSVSVYLLSTIESREADGIAPSALQSRFVEDYVGRLRAVPRRIDEQRMSGNLAIGSDGKLRLTAQGEQFMRFSRLVAPLFGTDPRFVDAAPTKGPAHR